MAAKSEIAAPAEERPNFNYGIDWERWVGGYFLARFGGHFELSPGSRGAADCVNYGRDVIICTQCKASRGASKAHPSVSRAEKQALRDRAAKLAASRKTPAVAMLALIKGNKVKFKNLGLFGATPKTPATKLK